MEEKKAAESGEGEAAAEWGGGRRRSYKGEGGAMRGRGRGGDGGAPSGGARRGASEASRRF